MNNNSIYNIMSQNNKGNSIIILLVVFVLIGLAYVYSFKGNEAAVENILGDTGLIDESKSENPYTQAMDAAKKVKLLQMRPAGEDDYYIGSLDAPVKIIYYSDFECPFCVPYVESLDKVVANYGDDVLLVFRHFILNNHNSALEAALASECAAEQDSFWEMYSKLYEDNEKQLLNNSEYIKDAEEIALNVEQFSTCLESEKYMEKIQNSVNEAKS